MESNILSQQTFQALARELKMPLTIISAQAEISQQNNIRKQAQDAMILIDSFLIASQTNYGQTQLELEPISVGSIFYKLSAEVSQGATTSKVSVDTETSCDSLVMSNRRGLEVGLRSLMDIAIANLQAKDSSKIKLRAYRRRDGKIFAGIFSPNLSLSQKDIERAKTLIGSAQQSVSTHFSGSGIQLILASCLAEALGVNLSSLKKGNLRGLGFELMKSEQLRIV